MLLMLPSAGDVEIEHPVHHDVIPAKAGIHFVGSTQKNGFPRSRE
jgi:hypothetical protein